MGKHYWIREEGRCCFRSSAIRRGHVLEEMVECVALAQPIGVDSKFVGGLTADLTLLRTQNAKISPIVQL